jgi:hypothetical protein
LIAIRKFGRVIGRTAYEERLAFVASTRINCDRGATVNADTNTGFEIGMIDAKALHHLAERRREGDRDPDTLALVFIPIWSKDDGMKPRSMKIDPLHIELIDELITAPVMGVEKFQGTAVAGLSFPACIDKHIVEIDEVRVNMNSIGGDCPILRDIDQCSPYGPVQSGALLHPSLGQKGPEILDLNVAFWNARLEIRNPFSGAIFTPCHRFELPVGRESLLDGGRIITRTLPERLSHD